MRSIRAAISSAVGGRTVAVAGFTTLRRCRRRDRRARRERGLRGDSLRDRSCGPTRHRNVDAEALANSSTVNALGCRAEVVESAERIAVHAAKAHSCDAEVVRRRYCQPRRHGSFRRVAGRARAAHRRHVGRL